jgi:hypothetical protein
MRRAGVSVSDKGHEIAKYQKMETDAIVISAANDIEHSAAPEPILSLPRKCVINLFGLDGPVSRHDQCQRPFSYHVQPFVNGLSMARNLQHQQSSIVD